MGNVAMDSTAVNGTVTAQSKRADNARVYSEDKNTLQDFKDRNNFNDGEIYEHGSNEMPDALSDYSDLLQALL